MYDVVIIGCGPAGMTAAIYLARANKKVLILEKESIGGQISSSPLVENYPSYIAIKGNELADDMFEQVINLNVEVELEEVIEIKDGQEKEIITEDNVYKTKAIIIATGAHYRLLGLDNEKNLIGNGIHFCVSCDGAFFKDKIVAVVGGGNTAAVNALYLANITKKVYVINNIESLTCEETLKDRLYAKDNIEIINNVEVKSLLGNDQLEAITIKEINNEKKLIVDGMFISIGLIPETTIVKDLLGLKKDSSIDSDDCKTDIDGIFVAGDCRNKKYRQLTTAVNDGTIAANEAIKYLNNIN